MTSEQLRRYREDAKHERETGNYVAAGDLYSQVAFGQIGHRRSLYPSGGAELRKLLEVCTCYRVGGADELCSYRAQMGALLAEELATRAFTGDEPTHAFDQAMRGVWYEFVGDFRTVGEFGNPDEAYERATETYEAAGNPLTSALEGSLSPLTAYFYSVASAADADMDEIYEATAELPFSEMTEYKRARFPGYLETSSKTAPSRSNISV